MGTQTSAGSATATVPSDGALVRACRAGEPGAWAALVGRFDRYVYAIASQAYRLGEHDAQDVFQDVFARTYQHLDRLRDDDAIRPWIGQLTRRLAIDRLRAAKRERPEDEGLDVLDERASDEIERLDQALSVRDALGTLSGDCQEILDRFFARGESYREISDALDLAMGTIASRISRCLAKLRSQLAEPSGV
ncbi:MAG: polymerase sigma factor [Solirubrobacterales bacterium]|nr:polymerase sigma factor [Solirubrobacterales bacterium]